MGLHSNTVPAQNAVLHCAPRPPSHTAVMAKSGDKKKQTGGRIAQNKRARHDYFLEDKFEAGLALLGWEVKSIRDGRAQIGEAYVNLHRGEAYLEGANITPMLSASTHVVPEPQRRRKLLLHAHELARIFAATSQKGYTCIATVMYWKDNKVKLEIALGKGKQQHDKRMTKRDQDWQRDKQRLMKATTR
jgi:SsrA-binding protein